ncbi:MAG: helix-turn-helix domain-containing protein, partial [Terriglobales bacterium]
KEDIPELAEFFAGKFARAAEKALPRLSAEAMAKLVGFDWPGNVRELENVIERAVALGDGTALEASDIRLELLPTASPRAGAAFLPEGWTLEKWEQEVIREALKRAAGNKSQAARLLGLSRNALRYRLSTMGVDDSEPGG